MIWNNFPEKKYDIVALDPPWHYRGQIQHNGVATTGCANAHYSTVPLKDMLTLPLETLLNPDSLVFMWATAPCLEDALALGNARGLKYATIAFVWNKVRPNPGYYTMSQCEYVLVWKNGKIPQPRGARNVRQFFESECYTEKRGRHSEKPTEIYDRITEMFPEQSKLELFARKPRDGWEVWGNEVG